MQFFIDLLAAVPSVIYGLLGVFIVVPLVRTVIYPALNKPFGYLPIFKGPSYGVGFLTAGIVLAIMVIPYIISVSREVLLSVPRDQREAALALGSTRWESTWKVVVPVREDRHYGVDLPGTGARLGGDDGGDDGDREHAEDQRFFVRAGLLDRGGYRQ